MMKSHAFEERFIVPETGAFFIRDGTFLLGDSKFLSWILQFNKDNHAQVDE